MTRTQQDFENEIRVIFYENISKYFILRQLKIKLKQDFLVKSGQYATGWKCNRKKMQQMIIFFYPVDPLTLYVLKKLLARVWNALDWLLSLGSAQLDQNAKSRQNLINKFVKLIGYTCDCQNMNCIQSPET